MKLINGFWKFLNTHVGLLLLGFILTTVLGTILTDKFQQAAQEREAKLEHQRQRETEQYRMILQQIASKEEIQYKQLHEDRATAIRTLNDMIVDVEKNLFDLYYKYRPIGIHPPQPEEKDVVKSVRKLRNLNEKYRIYFNLELCKLIDSLCKSFEEGLRSLEQAYIRGDPGRPPEFEETKFLEIRDHSRAVRKNLEHEFRIIILGVK